ncbi:ATP-dependent Clp protease adaptor ClpS [Clostridium sp. AL.422]|uniref:ATP-dependent Clp protease adaptor ClpS n=1 Tax=Clostridium TaxID=1485 RepID=UPI00293DD8B6|nr:MULTISPECIES: ATP-dependent Clp protease adaptor ClpS [unclassified Clostridium]MDV4149622.1 ATP-dependent Clp protease adaptor ClpS [Clostridium sp. AL.422]
METNSKVIERSNIKVKVPKKYRVIMYNDDFTTMEFVVAILNIIFNKDFEQANKIMMEVHKTGRGIAGVYPYDIAMTKANKAMAMAKDEGFPFKLTVEED